MSDKCVPLSIGIQNEDGAFEHGVSFNGPNPEEKDFIPVESAAIAGKLVKLIRAYFPDVESEQSP